MAKAHRRENAISHLEAALERVRNGETVSVAIAELRSDGAPTLSWSDLDNVNAMVGAIERLKHKIMSEVE